MSDLDAVNLVLFIFRVGLGAMIIAHGVNHIYGGGKIDGTAAWFGSIGMKQPVMQAWMASITEIASGVLLVIGLFTPLGAAGLAGVMAVAWVTAHRNNGFFIFKPGQGWEYVMVVLLCAFVLGTVGPGQWSLDEAFDIDWFGTTGFLIVLILGVGGAAAQLATFWRPPPQV